MVKQDISSPRGMVSIRSSFSVKETAERMENILKKKSMTVFNRIKHSEDAKKVGIELRDTELILFGNPKVGSPLMKCRQTVAIDLPQKALIWKDEMDRVWISYNDPSYIGERHQMTGCEEMIVKIEKTVANIAESASRD